ncbi:hypothetical protein B0O80DRAFT_430097 [Mortierella sp. GBAus27b]|nr:hypothetical protein B0O80DRAFT_430097 [Mortierella sp. GBAus27b]
MSAYHRIGMSRRAESTFVASCDGHEGRKVQNGSKYKYETITLLRTVYRELNALTGVLNTMSSDIPSIAFKRSRDPGRHRDIYDHTVGTTRRIDDSEKLLGLALSDSGVSSQDDRIGILGEKSLGTSMTLVTMNPRTRTAEPLAVADFGFQK